MMRSLFSGVSGLKTHQTRMDVIGNNIANVNTVAYKSSSMTFSALMSQTTQRASGPDAEIGKGGVNARQIGLGVKTAAINTSITTQGASQNTGNPFDIMITGEEFFIVSDGSQNFFTRDGSFYIDGAGNLAMTSIGYNVMGWQVDEETQQIKQDTVSALRIMTAANMTYPPEATSAATMTGIMDRNEKNAASTSGKTVNLNVYDNLGYSYTVKFNFKQSDDPYNYSIELDKIIDSNGEELDISALEFGTENNQQQRQTTLGFDPSAYSWDGLVLKEGLDEIADLSQMFANGVLKERTEEITVKDGAGNDVTLTVQEALENIAKAHGYKDADEFLNLYKNVAVQNGDTTTNQVVRVETMLGNLASNNTTNPSADAVFPQMNAENNTYTLDGRYFNGNTIQYNSNNGKFAGVGGVTTNTKINLNLSALGGHFKDIEIDLSATQSSDNKGVSTIAADKGDADGKGTGRQLGDMIGVTIQQNGEIYASYDSGMSRLLGQIAVAHFPNASGLEKQGNNLYSTTLNSGTFDGVGMDITTNGGSMESGVLEMSNVDLASEFTEMITTQRGFQANSRIITVSDTLLEELTNLKR